MATPGSDDSHAKLEKHGLRISRLPAMNLNASAPLIGTPYATSPPFEYPFPTPMGTPYSTAVHSSFPFAPSLFAAGQSYPFPGSRAPFRRGPVSSNRPPVPPSLKLKAAAKAKASQSAPDLSKP